MKAALQTKPQSTAVETSVDKAAAVEEVRSTTASRTFSLDQLQQAWQAYFLQLKGNGGSPIELMLNSAGLVLEDSCHVKVMLSSSLQEEPFDRLKPKIQYFLRQHLQNDGLSLSAQLAEEEGPRKLYTNSEKFQHLMQRYPLLVELKDRLGLEADF